MQRPARTRTGRNRHSRRGRSRRSHRARRSHRRSHRRRAGRRGPSLQAEAAVGGPEGAERAREVKVARAAAGGSAWLRCWQAGAGRARLQPGSVCPAGAPAAHQHAGRSAVIGVSLTAAEAVVARGEVVEAAGGALPVALAPGLVRGPGHGAVVGAAATAAAVATATAVPAGATVLVAARSVTVPAGSWGLQFGQEAGVEAVGTARALRLDG